MTPFGLVSFALRSPFSRSEVIADVGAWGHNKVAETFDKDVAQHFLKSTRLSYAKRRALKQGKPLLVILTKRGCGACQNLKQSVNNGKDVCVIPRAL